MAHWEPPVELKRLLDALSDEIVASSEGDTYAGNIDNATGVLSRKALARLTRMRELIDDAIDEPGEARERVLLPELAAIGELRQRPN